MESDAGPSSLKRKGGHVDPISAYFKRPRSSPITGDGGDSLELMNVAKKDRNLQRPPLFNGRATDSGGGRPMNGPRAKLHSMPLPSNREQRQKSTVAPQPPRRKTMDPEVIEILSSDEERQISSAVSMTPPKPKSGTPPSGPSDAIVISSDEETNIPQLSPSPPKKSYITPSIARKTANSKRFFPRRGQNQSPDRVARNTSPERRPTLSGKGKEKEKESVTASIKVVEKVTPLLSGPSRERPPTTTQSGSTSQTQTPGSRPASQRFKPIPLPPPKREPPASPAGVPQSFLPKQKIPPTASEAGAPFHSSPSFSRGTLTPAKNIGGVGEVDPTLNTTLLSRQTSTQSSFTFASRRSTARDQTGLASAPGMAHKSISVGLPARALREAPIGAGVKLPSLPASSQVEAESQATSSSNARRPSLSPPLIRASASPAEKSLSPPSSSRMTLDTLKNALPSPSTTGVLSATALARSSSSQNPSRIAIPSPPDSARGSGDDGLEYFVPSDPIVPDLLDDDMETEEVHEALSFDHPRRTRTGSRRSSRSANSMPAPNLFDDDMETDEVDEAHKSRSRRATESSRRSSRSASSTDPLDILHDGFDSPFVKQSPRSSGTPEDTLWPESGIYGGIQSITWNDYRDNIRANLPCVYAKDLPHALQDHINIWSETSRQLLGLRHTFEAAMMENTTEEPDAPPIKIINEVDHEPVPPWEFHYSNLLWHGEGVPPPDGTNLISCGCTGRCDPKSKTCACLHRQREATSGEMKEFAYDSKGRLKMRDYPIFECNALCGCDEECRNRVVQNGRKVSLNIAKTRNKGWGVFAGPKKIYAGTFIGVYAGEILTNTVSNRRGVTYNAFGRTYLFDLDFHHLSNGQDDWEVKYTMDAYHAGNFTRFLNHSCDPNSHTASCYINEGDIDKPMLVIFASRDIEPLEEICFDYTGDPEDEDANDKVKKDGAVYVQCQCGSAKCTGKMFR